MKKVLKQFLPALVCTAIVGCETMDTDKQVAQVEASAQTEVAAMPLMTEETSAKLEVKLAESVTTEQYVSNISEEQIIESAKIRRNKETKAEENIKKCDATKEQILDELQVSLKTLLNKKRETIAQSRCLVRMEQKKLENTELMREFDQYNELSIELDKIEKPQAHVVKKDGEVVIDDSFLGKLFKRPLKEVDEHDVFIYEDTLIKRQIVEDRKKHLADSYDNLKKLVLGNIDVIIADCDKKVNVIDKAIKGTKNDAVAQINIENNKIELNKKAIHNGSPAFRWSQAFRSY